MEKNLLSEFPEIAKEWDYKTNDKGPEEYAPHSNKKVWWICPVGHSYECTIDHRTGRGQGCAYCSGKRVLAGFNDLKTKEPELVKEWDYEENELTPEQVTVGSNKKVAWICSTCGNKWKAMVNDRAGVERRGCPVCAKQKRIKSFLDTWLKPGVNDLKTKRPDLVKEWDYYKNKDVVPEGITFGSDYKAWWICATCGNSWQATVSNRANNNSGCPICSRHKSTSFPEQAMYFYLSKIFPNTVNSYKDIFSSKKMELDLYIPELKTGVEYDGIYWHSTEYAKKKAKEKYDICSKNGVKLIRVSEAVQESYDDSDMFIYREELTDEGLNECIRELISKITDQRIDIDVEQDRAAIMSLYITVLKDKSIAALYPDAVWEWDVEKNHGLTADMVNANSNVKYWWKCKLGHSYKSTPANKLPYGYGCSICSGHIILPGFNDLETKYPEIAKEWDYEQNKPLTPNHCSPGSQRKVWWICPKGHSYNSQILNRTGGKTNCPICFGKIPLEGYNDLFTTNPELKMYWDYEKNDISPTKLSYGSTRTVWWKCEEGHSWRKTVQSQIRVGKCPVCNYLLLIPYVNDLSVSNPEIASEWNYARNNGLTPHDVIKRSTKKVWWKCHSCGNEWETRIDLRIRGIGCPVCGYSKKMQSTRASNTISKKFTLMDKFPEIAKEWDYAKNDGMSPDSISYGANYKVGWICPKGHHYEAWISDRTGKRKTGCPECSYLAKAKKVMCIETGEVYNSPRLAAEAVRKKAVTISAAARNQSKTCGGYHWKYV